MSDFLFHKSKFIVHEGNFIFKTLQNKIAPSLDSKIRKGIRNMYELWELENRIREYFSEKEN